MIDFDQHLPSSFSFPLPMDFGMPRPAVRAMAMLTTPPATLSNRPYVCTCWWTTAPRRTGRPRRWCSNWVTWPPVGYAVLSLFWRHQTVDSVTRGKALADLAFPLQVSNRPILRRTSRVSTAKCPRLSVGLTSLFSHYWLLCVSVSLYPVVGDTGIRIRINDIHGINNM